MDDVRNREAHPTQLFYFIRKQLIYLQVNDNKTCILTIKLKLQNKNNIIPHCRNSPEIQNIQNRLSLDYI